MFLIVSALHAVLLPLGAGYDEPFHIARVYQLAQGSVLPQELSAQEMEAGYPSAAQTGFKGYGGQVDSALFVFALNGNLQYQVENLWLNSAIEFPSWTDSRLSTDSAIGEETVAVLFPNTAINSPVCYLPYVPAYMLATLFSSSPAIAILAMRFTGILFFSFALYFLIRLAPIGKWVLLFCSLLSQTTGTFFAVTADLMTFVCFAGFVVFVLRMIYADTPSRFEWGGLAVFAVALCVVKVTYMPFIALLLVIPVCNENLRNGRCYAALAGIACAALGLFCLWYLQIRGVNTGIMWYTDIDPEAQKEYVLAYPLAFAVACVKSLLAVDGFCLGPSMLLPSMLLDETSLVGGYALSAAALAVILVAEVRCAYPIPRRWFFCLVCLLCCVVVSILIALALYLQFTLPGETTIEGLQPRYFLPIAFVVQIVLALVLCKGQAQRMGAFDFALPIALCAMMSLWPVLSLAISAY